MIETTRTTRLFGKTVSLHSQPATAQDEWVIEVTRGQVGGYFVEIGGYDGLRHSNTLALEESFGWRGLLVEADPDLAQQAVINRPLCAHFNKAVAGYSGTESPFLKGGPWGGLAGLMPRAWKEEHEHRHTPYIWVPTITLQEAFDAAEAPEVIDYLSLDTEGAEVSTLKAFYRLPNRIVRCMTVEYLQDAATLHQLCRILEPHGYILDQVRAWGACFWLAGQTHPTRFVRRA